MALHYFWEGHVENHKGQKLAISVHSVGLSDDPEAILNHLKTHNFPRAKDVVIKPYEGLINFHGYPVRGPNDKPHTVINEAGELVNAQSGAVLFGPDGKEIKVSHENIVKPIQDDRGPKQSNVVPIVVRPKPG